MVHKYSGIVVGCQTRERMSGADVYPVKGDFKMTSEDIW
jgi:hypothetical protein